MKKNLRKDNGVTDSVCIPKKRSAFAANLYKYRYLYIMLIPGILHYLVFRYLPLGGLVIAFQKFNLYAGIGGSEFVGFKNFIDLFTSNDLPRLIKNTILLGTYTLLWGIPLPIIFAVALNEIKVNPFKKFVQSVSYIPSLISTVVVASMVIDFLSPSTGIVNHILASLGFEKHYFMADPKWFRRIYVTSELWSTFGYNAIMYFSAITSIGQELYEAAEVDGCSRLRKIWHITLPGLLPTICTMTILNAGNIFKIGADKALLLYNPLTYETADIFGTFVYRRGLVDGSYSYAAAAGMFESVVAFAVVLLTNTLSKKLSENSLW